MKASLLAALSAAWLLGAGQPARVIVVSLDGLGHQTLTADPVAQELTVLHWMLRHGAAAQGMRAHFPSTTANSHAALFTGAWGDVSGISSNTMPVTPRAEHTAFERRIGYRSDGLRAEPLWVAAARQGVRVVAQQVTQAFPFSPQSVGAGLKMAPVVANGYQTRLLAKELFLHRKDVTPEACSQRLLSRRPPLCFSWKTGTAQLHGALIARAATYDTLTVRTAAAAAVEAHLAPLETEPPRRRPLARHFSPGLFFELDATPVVAYFRLFEAAPDGSDFFFFQTPLHEFGLYDGTAQTPNVLAQLLLHAGGFVGNAPGAQMTRAPFALGTPLWKGGDGAAERRYLEIVELVVRQAARHSEWLWRHYQPRLLIGYFSYPDEMDHEWKGLAARDPRYQALRRWGYAIVNRGAGHIAALRQPKDHLLFVSDHGMAVVDRQVLVNVALRKAGLIAAGATGKLDEARTAIIHNRNCLLVNTTEWKGGIVPLAQREAILLRAETALRTIRDPETGTAVVTRFFGPDAAPHFGFGGPSGSDACIDYAPGYEGVDRIGANEEPTVVPMDPPLGYHGFNPDREEMKAILLGVGPRLNAGLRWQGIRSIDVARLIAGLLHIDPPSNSQGIEIIEPETN